MGEDEEDSNGYIIHPKYHFRINIGLIYVLVASFSLIMSIIHPAGIVTHVVNGLMFATGLVMFSRMKWEIYQTEKEETWNRLIK